jgi:hypothetical protein
MTRIGILSDTHLDRVTDTFKETARREFQDVDLIIHAGDMTSRSVYDYLANWKLFAVRGNMDDYDLSLALPEHRIEEIEGRRVAIIHGWGSPMGLPDLILQRFRDVDLIVFGHTHVPLAQWRGPTLLFNPGSYRGYPGRGGTVGIIELGEQTVFSHRDVS